MTRRTLRLLVILALSCLMASPAADAQREGKVARIGLLIPVSSTVGAPFLEAFQQGLRELSYVEGKHFALEIRSAEGHYERLPVLGVELVQARVDVLVAWSTAAGYALQQATGTIPIVLIGTFDPVASGLATSLARPGHNLTGVLSSHPGLVGKWLELLKAAVPGASRIAVLSNPTNPNHRRGPPASAPSARPLQEVAQALGVTLQRVEAQRPDEIERAFRTVAARRADALVVLSDQVFWTHRTRIVDLAREHHLPTIYEWRSYVEAGGLMAYGANAVALHRRAAALVDKILKGAKPTDLPIEQPMTFELVVNLKTAQALGLTMPPTLLLQATEVMR